MAHALGRAFLTTLLALCVLFFIAGMFVPAVSDPLPHEESQGLAYAAGIWAVSVLLGVEEGLRTYRKQRRDLSGEGNTR